MKAKIMDAMREALTAYYTKRPSEAAASVPLNELAEATMATIADVDRDRIPVVPKWDPELTPLLRWNEPGKDLAVPANGVGVSVDGEAVVLHGYEGDYANPDRQTTLNAADAQAFAMAILAAVERARA